MTTLGFQDFSRQMVQTGDLDPVYIAVACANIPPDQMKRWLLAYGLFYHVGSASYFSEFTDSGFWEQVSIAARNDVACPAGGRWPRASERRHFRGDFSVGCVELLRNRYPFPEGFIDYIRQSAPNVKDVRARVEDHKGFGGWASFKFADLLDRVIAEPVEFDVETAMYDTPVKGAKLVWAQHHPDEPEAPLAECIGFADRLFKEATNDLYAPPFYDRPLGYNELETALCKFKSHAAGRYPVGKDINECLHAATPWAEISRTATVVRDNFQKLKNAMSDQVAA